MITLQMRYMPPPGADVPFVGDKIRTITGKFEVLEILERKDSGELLLRMGRDHFPGCDRDDLDFDEDDR